MSKVASAVALSLLLLAACGGGERESGKNGADVAEANDLGSGTPSGPGQPVSPVAAPAEPVPPPDAVSHPGGYLPPAPGEAEPANVNSSAPDSSPPATEDEYIRNKQSGR